MMNGREKSDSAIVARKPANNAGKPAAEWVEPRAGTKRNTGQSHTCRAQNRASVSQGLDRVRQAARQRKKERFTALLHHVTIDRLRASFFALKRNAAPGVDGLTCGTTRQDWKTTSAPARASTQWSVPGTTRTATVHTEAGWQTAPAGDCRAGRQDRPARGGRSAERDLRGDFLGFSYGFRPGRSQHDALDALATAITGTPVNWILDTDLKSFLIRSVRMAGPFH